MDELEQLKSNFLRSLKAAEEQSGLDLSWLKVQYLQLFEAAQHSVQADLLPCGHSSDNLGNFGGCNPMGSCVICDAATSR